MFDLPGFMRAPAVEAAVETLKPTMQGASFTHSRDHNIYFADDVPGLPADHPALRRYRTVNHTLCGDQLVGNPIERVYEYPPLIEFLAKAMQVPRLYVMADHMARLNVMGYRDGEALNWHFDRTHSTTTVLLQSPSSGGKFQYRSGLRTEADANYQGVARLLQGEDPETRTLEIEPGTLNVFLGKNTAHRITPVEGGRERLIAVFSYYDRPGVLFSEHERLGFYGRAA